MHDQTHQTLLDHERIFQPLQPHNSHQNILCMGIVVAMTQYFSPNSYVPHWSDFNFSNNAFN